MSFLVFIKFQTEILNFVGEKIFLEMHQNKLAIRVLEFNRGRPQAAPSDKTTLATTHFLLGRLYFVDGQLYKSVQNYSKAIELNPDEKVYYYGRGLSLGFASPIFYSDAESDFKKYIELDNLEFQKSGFHAFGAWAGYNDLAWIHFLQGNFDEAEKVSRAGLEISNLNPWLSNMLGVILLEKNSCDEALVHLSNAKNLIRSIKSEQFGEAYSGDKPDFWELGKEEMEKTINENLKLCQSEITFPQFENSSTTNL